MSADWIQDAVQELESPLLRYASSVLKDDERARDVVQDAFLRLCREERAAVDGHLREWLFTVCRHRALDVLRKEGRMTTTSEPDTGLASPHDDPARASETRDDARRVLALLETIPDKQREAIRLKFQGGLSYAQIARVTDCSVGYVGFLIHTGLQALRDKARASHPAPEA